MQARPGEQSEEPAILAAFNMPREPHYRRARVREKQSSALWRGCFD